MFCHSVYWALLLLQIDTRNYYYHHHNDLQFTLRESQLDFGKRLNLRIARAVSMPCTSIVLTDYTKPGARLSTQPSISERPTARCSTRGIQNVFLVDVCVSSTCTIFIKSAPAFSDIYIYIYILDPRVERRTRPGATR